MVLYHLPLYWHCIVLQYTVITLNSSSLYHIGTVSFCTRLTLFSSALYRTNTKYFLTILYCHCIVLHYIALNREDSALYHIENVKFCTILYWHCILSLLLYWHWIISHDTALTPDIENIKKFTQAVVSNQKFSQNSVNYTFIKFATKQRKLYSKSYP